MNRLRIAITSLVMCVATVVMAQRETIVTGRIWSDDEPEGIISAYVHEVDGYGRVYASAVTDFNGNFSLGVKNTDHKLKVSYISYKTQMLSIGNKRKFDIKMQDESVLKEVVFTQSRFVAGGGLSIPEREYSGAMQRFNTKELEGLSVASIDDALQGRIAGLDIVANSGDVGSGTKMRIRGVTSINSNNEPLILLNDIPFESNIEAGFDFNTADEEQFANLLCISPDDIEEITVLKDGAAAAIWGSRGANGVINIRTKKGTTGPTRVSYSYRLSGNYQPKGTKLLNGDDYTMLMKQAYFNRNQEDCNIPEYSYDRGSFINAYGSATDFENFNNNTDWVKEVSKYGWTNDHNLSVSGGGDKAKFRASLGYYRQTGTIIKQGLSRYNTRLNLEYNVSDRLKFETDFALTYTDNDKTYYDGSDDGLLSIAYKKMPNVSIFRQDALGNDTPEYFNINQSSQLNGDQKNLRNPVALGRLASYQQTSMRIMPTFRLQYDFIEPTNEQKLRYQGYVKFDSENVKDNKFLPRELTSENWNSGNVNKSYNKEAEAMTIYTDHNITYQPNLGEDHSLLLYGGWQMDMSRSKYQEFERYGLPSTTGVDMNLDGHISAFGSAKGEGRSQAFLLRAHYFLMDRYILDVTARWDGSSRFGSNNRWGFFPAVSTKWLISSEKWMEDTKSWLSELALRLGWGVTGNRPGSEYLHFSRYNSFGSSYIDMTAIKPSSLRLSNLKWERSTSYNLGVDVSLFNSRYRLVGNIYHRSTDDLLFSNQSIPSSTGFGSLSYINAGTMDNNGWELEFHTSNMVKRGPWTLDVSVNLSNYRNTIKSLNENVLNGYNPDFSFTNGSYLSRLQIGNSFGSIYGFRYLGVYQYDKYQPNNPTATCPIVRDANGNAVLDSRNQTVPVYFAYGTSSAYQFRGGDAIYEDINNDGTIDELDIVYLGNSNPKFDGGFGATLRYKRFSLNTFFNFRVGSKIVNYARMYEENMYSTNNQSIAVNWRWRKDGDMTEMPRALYQYGYNWLASDRYVESGSFLRLKQMTLMYSFDPKRIKKAHMTTLNLSCTLNNMLTLTKYTGADPEVSVNRTGIAGDNNRTPRARYFTFNVTVGF